MKSLLFSLVVAVVLVACGENQSKAKEQPQSKADSLLQAVIDVHDIAMPKTKKMERLLNESKTAIDSIDKLPSAAQKQNAALKARLEAAHAALEQANTAMNEWMNGFKYDSLKDNETARIQYLRDQQVKVTAVKDLVLNSVSKADSILPKK
ncbi:MAG: viral A-type inclusion protein [Niabella sp.]|nr:viral A-type inclusion protein [Niabella sp.]